MHCLSNCWPRYEENLTVHTRPTAATATRILGSDFTPGMLARKDAALEAPLSADVLRAFDNHRSEEVASASATGCLSDFLR